MADKVLRFTAEDSGYGQAIDRMAAKLRSAFSGAGGGMSDILQEADSKFSNFADKLKFIRGELGTIKEANEEERRIAVRDAVGENTKAGSPRSSDIVQREVSREYEKQEKSFDRLAASIDKFGERVEEAANKQEQGGGEEPPAPPPISPREEKPEGYGGGIANFLSGTMQVALGFGIAQIGAKIIGAITGAIREGTDLARQEYVIGRQFTLPSDLLNDRGGRTRADAGLGVKSKELLEWISSEAAGQRSANDVPGLVNDAQKRIALNRSYNVSQEQFGGLDRFYRLQQGGGTIDRSGFDATRTITELLVRAERQGILGVSKNDFTMLPEKIGQVTSMVQQQYSTTERTNANQALSLTLAGNRIGGFFDRDPAGTFGKLGEGISNPRSQGMRAFVLEAIRRANPGVTSPLQLEGLQQEGLSNEGNVKAIFGAIQNVRSREARGRILQSMGLDAQSAYRLSGAGNLQTFTQAAGVAGGGQLTAGERTQAEKGIQERGEQLTLTMDKAGTYFSNSLTSFGVQLQQWTEALTKSKSILNSTNGTTTNKVIPATPAGK